MSDDLNLNSLNRFRKQSPKLVLESHCEVPAGCGGVVLRWRNPDEGIPLILYVRLWDGKCNEIFADGNNVQTGRVTLPAGEHSLAIHLTNITARRVLMVAGRVDNPRSRDDIENTMEDLVTSTDNSWKFSLESPDEDWQLSEYDDQDWEPLQIALPDSVADEEDRPYWLRRFMEWGAVPLVLPESASEVWIRKRFQVENME